jgi:hypothetical protein
MDVWQDLIPGKMMRPNRSPGKNTPEKKLAVFVAEGGQCRIKEEIIRVGCARIVRTAPILSLVNFEGV